MKGFEASLKQRGALLSVEGTSDKLRAIVEPLGASVDEMEAGQDGREHARIYALKSEPGLASLKLDGSEANILSDEQNGESYLALRYERARPSDVVVIIHCLIEQ